MTNPLLLQSAAPWLVIESSTARGSVALVAGGRVLESRSVALRAREVERLMPAVADVLASAGLVPGELGGVVCGSGPGSFTGLRIGGGIAKGIAYGTSRPLYAVPSLLLLAATAAARHGSGRYLATADAMREDRFVLLAECDAAGTVAQRESPAMLASDALAPLAAAEGARIVAPGEDDLWPDAGAVVLVGDGVVGPVSVAGWEPTYGRLAEAQVKWEIAHGRPLPRS